LSRYFVLSNLTKSNAWFTYRQLRWNLMSKSSVYKRMVCGAKWPTMKDYENVICPVLLIGAEKVRAFT
jgi:hypothetical protein